MLKRNLIANYLGQGLTAIIGIVFIPMYINLLGIESYGLIGLFGLLQSWLTLLEMSMTSTLSREMARFTGGTHSMESIRDLLRSTEAVAIVVAIMIVLGIAISADWLSTSWVKAVTLPVSVVSEALTIMGLVISLRFLESIYRSSINGLQKQVLLNIVSVILAIVRALGALAILMWFSASINAFFLWQGLLSLVTLAVFAFITYDNLPKGSRGGKFSLVALSDVLRFSGGMIGIAFLALLLTTMDKVILVKLLTLSEYGYYTLASVAAGALYMLVGPITATWFPRLCQLNATGDNKGFANSYHQGSQLISVVAGSAAIVVIVNSEILLYLWTQDLELSSRTAPLLRLLILGNLLNALMWMPYQAQLAHGWTSLGVSVNTVAVIIFLPAIFYITPQYGAIGAAILWVILNACYCLVGVHLMYRRILRGEKWGWYQRDVFQPILASVSVAIFIKWCSLEPVGIAAQLFFLFFSALFTLGAAVLAAKEVRKLIHKELTKIFK